MGRIFEDHIVSLGLAACGLGLPPKALVLPPKVLALALYLVALFTCLTTTHHPEFTSHTCQ